MRKLVVEQINESIQVKQRILQDENYIDTILKIAYSMAEAFNRGNKVMLCGNGGSSADAQHMAAELVCKFRMERKGLPALAITSNSSITSALANDYEYDRVFSRQVEAFGNKGDILLTFSTSGKSKSITSALKKARESGIQTIALLGKDGGDDITYADISIVIPSFDTARVQESHVVIYHIICDVIEQLLFGEKDGM